MRRWIVERRLVPAPLERVSALLERRVTPTRVPLPGHATEAWLDVRIHVEPASAASTWLVVMGAYPAPRDATGRPVDTGERRRDAKRQARMLLDGLGDELATAVAPLPGIEPFGEPPAPEPSVRDVMDTDVPAIDDDLDLHAAAALLAAAGVEGAPVVDATGRLIGVLTERDLLAGFVRECDPARIDLDCPTAGTLCGKPALVTVPQLSALRAAQQMLYHGVRRLAVVEEGRLVGMVTRTALFTALRTFVPEPAAEQPVN